MARDFDSIESFIAFLETLPAAMRAAVPIGLDDAARFLQQKSKDCLGEYQEAEGPFGAWPQLADITMELRERHGFPPDEPLLVTEALRDNIERSVDGVTGEAAVGVPSKMVGGGGGSGWENPDHLRDIGEVALAQEMGIVGHIPQRSFLGSQAAKYHDELINMMVRPVITALSGESPGAFKMPDESGGR